MTLDNWVGLVFIGVSLVVMVGLGARRAACAYRSRRRAYRPRPAVAPAAPSPARRPAPASFPDPAGSTTCRATTDPSTCRARRRRTHP